MVELQGKAKSCLDESMEVVPESSEVYAVNALMGAYLDFYTRLNWLELALSYGSSDWKEHYDELVSHETAT